MVISDDDTLITTLDQMSDFITDNEAALVYFSGENCGVCQVMQPRVKALLEQRFPRIAFARVATEQAGDLAAQKQVFAVPTMLVFFDGRESFRYARNFSIAEVEQDVARPYSMFFEG